MDNKDIKTSEQIGGFIVGLFPLAFIIGIIYLFIIA